MGKKICFAASSGGHYEQLMMLKPLMEKYDSFVITEKTAYQAAVSGRQTYYMEQVNRKEWSVFPRMIQNTVRSIRIYGKEKPDVVICTGVLAMIPICLIAKLHGKKLIFIESFAKGNYSMRHDYYGEHMNVALKPLNAENLEPLRCWRNNKEQTKFLRPIGEITPEMQLNWFRSYLENPRDIIFGIYETEKLNRLVGSLSIYDIKDGRAEIGKIQIGDSEAHGRGIGRTSMVIAMKIGFELLGLTEIYASVHQDNIAARSNYLRIGFKIVGSHPSCVGGMEDEIVIHADELYAANPNADKIKIYTAEDA